MRIIDLIILLRLDGLGLGFEDVRPWAWKNFPRPGRGRSFSSGWTTEFDLLGVVRLFGHSVGEFRMVEGCGETLPYQYSGVGRFMERRPGWRGREMGGWLHTRRGGGSGSRGFLCEPVDFLTRGRLGWEILQNEAKWVAAPAGGRRLPAEF